MRCLAQAQRQCRCRAALVGFRGRVAPEVFQAALARPGCRRSRQRTLIAGRTVAVVDVDGDPEPSARGGDLRSVPAVGFHGRVWVQTRRAISIDEAAAADAEEGRGWFPGRPFGSFHPVTSLSVVEAGHAVPVIVEAGAPARRRWRGARSPDRRACPPGSQSRRCRSAQSSRASFCFWVSRGHAASRAASPCRRDPGCASGRGARRAPVRIGRRSSSPQRTSVAQDDEGTDSEVAPDVVAGVPRRVARMLSEAVGLPCRRRAGRAAGRPGGSAYADRPDVVGVAERAADQMLLRPAGAAAARGHGRSPCTPLRGEVQVVDRAPGQQPRVITQALT